jgi:hypothetical protein
VDSVPLIVEPPGKRSGANCGFCPGAGGGTGCGTAHQDGSAFAGGEAITRLPVGGDAMVTGVHVATSIVSVRNALAT